MAAKPKLQMFLSYAHVESRFADFIEASIRRDFIGLVSVFLASDGGILAGRKWLDDMTQALAQSHLHVVLCSPEAMTRHWISFETGAAHLRGIPLIPLCHSGLVPNQLPVPLSEFQGVRLSAPEGSNSAGQIGFRAFYGAIADILASDVPQVDFDSYDRQLAAIEQVHAKEHGRLAEGSVDQTGVEILRNPRALCISSHQFMRQGFENQIELVLNAFPASLHHDRVLDSDALKRVLTTAKVHVVHIAAYVCPRSGELYFSDVQFSSGEPIGQPVDRITADALAQLLKTAETRLVVITGSDSMALTATLLDTCHVIAARDMVSPQMMATWVKEFYSMLPHYPLSKALEFAMKASRAPMRFYAKQPQSVDVILEMAGGPPSAARLVQEPQGKLEN